MPAAPKQQPFQWTPVRIPFSGGVDTRSERKAVPPLKLGLLENAVFTTPGVLRKRFGYEKLASLALDNLANAFVDQVVTNARALMTRGQSLWLRGAEDIYSLAPDRKRWQREAQVPSARLVYGPRQLPLRILAAVGGTERATVNGVTMFASDGDFVGSPAMTVVFVDDDGTELARTSFLGAHARAVVVGRVICLFYYNQPTADKIFMVSFNTDALRTSNAFAFSAATVVSDLSTTAPSFDVDAAPGGQVLLAYNSTTASTLKFGYVTVAGALNGALSTIATAFTPVAVSCAVEPSVGTLLVAWLMSGTVRVDAQMFNAAKSSLFASVTIGTTTDANHICMVTCIFRNPTTAEIFFDFDNASLLTHRVDRGTLTTAGAVTLTAGWLRHSTISSKPWLILGRVHLYTDHASFPDNVQRTGFVVVSGGAQDPCVIAAVYPNEIYPNSAANGLRKPFRPDVVGAFVWLTPRLALSLDPNDTYAGNVAVDYSHAPSFIEAGGATYFTGSALWMLDGTSVTETGFFLFPELSISSATQSTTGGGLVVGQSYSYRFYYEWLSASGELWQSTFAADLVVVITAGKDTVDIKVPSLVHTLKPGVRIAGYRTLAGGTIFHRVGAVANDPSADFVTFTDEMADAVAATGAFDYRSSSPPELSNLPPPGATAIAVGNTRVLLAGFEDTDLVIASKLLRFGTPVNFVGSAIQIRLPPAGGSPITALAAFGDSFVAFRATKCYVVGGDGPDDTGASGSFAPPRVLSDDIGCTGPGSIVRTPLGLMFQSQRGIYLLGGDGGLSYIGADVERYNNDTVTAAVSLPDRHEARFTLASGNTLVFDYLAKQWSVFTVGGLHAVIWQGRHVYLPTAAGAARAELAGSFLDDGQSFGWALEMAWLYVGDNQNQQMVKCLQFLGEFMGDHSAIVQIAYDYEQAYSDRIVVDMSTVLNGSHFGDDAFFGKFLSSKAGTFGGNIGPEGYTATGVYQFKVFPFRRRCQAIKVRWEEARRVDPAGVIQYAWNEGARLNELALEVGLRGGLWQPGNDRTFGG